MREPWDVGAMASRDVDTCRITEIGIWGMWAHVSLTRLLSAVGLVSSVWIILGSNC